MKLLLWDLAHMAMAAAVDEPSATGAAFSCPVVIKSGAATFPCPASAFPLA